MSATAKALFDSMKSVRDAVIEVAPGLKGVTHDVLLEGKRLGTQGAMELASALFSGNAFVPYGPGQYTPSAQQERGEQSRGMER